MNHEFARQRFARAGGFYQHLSVGFTKHLSFSARVFLAKKSRDFTVPTGTARSTETRRFAQSFEPPVCAKQGLLRDIFSIGIIAQDPARNAKRQRSVFRKQRFPFAMCRARRFRARSSARGGSLGLSSGMRQDPL